MAKTPKVSAQGQMRQRFISALCPLIKKGATADELYDLIKATCSAQHAGYLTYKDAQDIIELTIALTYC